MVKSELIALITGKFKQLSEEDRGSKPETPEFPSGAFSLKPGQQLLPKSL